MAWSTRELAELAGTTVNTVRHYHRLGLIEEPQRRYNGYKQYGVADLVRLLRIRRLADLGVPLAKIGALLAAGQDDTTGQLRELDAELASTIERLQQARDDIAVLLRENAPPDTPAGFESLATTLSDADGSMLHIYTRLYKAEALADLRRMMENDTATDRGNEEFDNLPADADDSTRRQLAEQLAPALAQHLRDFPWLLDPVSQLQRSEGSTRQMFVEAAVELYNPAQREVLALATILAHESLQAAAAAETD